MKVSKPIIIIAVIGVLLAGYIFLTTPKKQKFGGAGVVMTPPVTATTAQAPAQPPVKVPPGTPAKPGAPAGIPSKDGKAEAPQKFDKAQLDTLNLAWARDPFLLPKTKEEKRQGQEQEITFKLVAIMEKDGERVAIIDHEVVKKGDMIGGEKVMEIQKDKVILVRNGLKRVLNLTNIEDMVTKEEVPKTKGTERAK